MKHSPRVGTTPTLGHPPTITRSYTQSTREASAMASILMGCVLLLFSVTPGVLSTATPEQSLRDELVSIFPSSLSTQSKAKMFQIEFCPDETCIEFDLPKVRGVREANAY